MPGDPPGVRKLGLKLMLAVARPFEAVPVIAAPNPGPFEPEDPLFRLQPMKSAGMIRADTRSIPHVVRLRRRVGWLISRSLIGVSSKHRQQDRGVCILHGRRDDGCPLDGCGTDDLSGDPARRECEPGYGILVLPRPLRKDPEGGV